MRQPGFLSQLRGDLEKVPADMRSAINRPGGLHEDDLRRMLALPSDDRVLAPSPPEDHAVGCYHDDVDRYTTAGTQAINAGQVAYCILAGGDDTRMGEPKALARIPELDMSLLTLKLFQAVGCGPVWVMVSPSSKSLVEDHLASIVGIDASRVFLFEQFQSYRLSPDNRLLLDATGTPEVYPCGSGDFFPALVKSNLLPGFIAGGGKYLAVVGVDNVFASLEPAVIGHHIENASNVTCEVVRRKKEETGGVLVEAADGLQIAEMNRLDVNDLASYTWLSTNSYVMNVDLEYPKLGVNWYRTMKNAGGKAVVQYERFLHEVTAAYNSSFLGVSRTERYMPVATPDDLMFIRNIVNIDV